MESGVEFLSAVRGAKIWNIIWHQLTGPSRALVKMFILVCCSRVQSFAVTTMYLQTSAIVARPRKQLHITLCYTLAKHPLYSHPPSLNAVIILYLQVLLLYTFI